MSWDKGQAKQFAKRAKASAGDGWSLLSRGRDLQECFVARQVLSVLFGQATDTLRVADIEKLWQDTLEAAGLGPEHE